ncbi:MAG: hypothetical protein PF495_16835 [Spirochaetales bacterium]|nr:hypothetical protein [Spirochaetales bacterium]
MAERILNDRKLEKIREMGYEILKTGFNAGYGYQQVWARDMNKMASGFASHRNIPHSLSLETMQSSMFKF